MKFINPKTINNYKKKAVREKIQKSSRSKPVKPRTQTSYHIGFLNMRGQQNKLVETENLLRGIEPYQTLRPIDFLGCAETWETEAHDYRTSSHTWFGTPSNRNSAGVGFWVNNKYKNQCTTPDFLTKHPDIMWLQFVTKTGSYFLAVFYSRPGQDHIETHESIMDTLQINCIELDKLGTPIIVGDVNADMIKYSHTGHSKKIKTFCQVTKMLSLKDPSIADKDSWSFKGVMGTSLPDHIFIPNDFHGSIERMKIHQKISCNSDHRLISCVMKTNPHTPMEQWGNYDKLKIEWNEDNITKYQKNLNKSLQKIDLIKQEIHPKHNIDNWGRLITNSIRQAIQKIKKENTQVNKADNGHQIDDQ
jgi:hypothetical protein